ncbi:MAG: M14 family zinc carboxypeptidase [Sedimentisphaerales bacterium]
MCARIENPAAQDLARQLIEAGFDVPGGSITEDHFDVIVSDAELAILTQNGLQPQKITVGRPFRDIQNQRLALSAVPSGYPDLAQIRAEMDAVEAEFPSICQVADLTETYGVAATFEGRHIFAVKISDHVTEDEDEPAFLLVGAHHAREIVTPVIALYAVEQFTQQYDVDPAITALVDEYEIWVAPVWNPDGYEYVFTTDNYWRKNRTTFSDGVGVDLNRNYPFGWDAPCGGSTAVTSQTYRGPAAASEPETQTMVAFGDDRHFAKVADLHSYAREVRYGNGCLSYPFMSFLATEANDLAMVAGYQPSLSCCTGGDIHFHNAYHGSHAFLWETHGAFQPGYASARSEAARVFPSVLALLERPICLSGHVTDALTGEAVAATITTLDVTFENGETNESDERRGRYHAFMPEGTYTLEFDANGYFPEYRTVEVVSGLGQVMDVAMMPSGVDVNDDDQVDMADRAALADWEHQSESRACCGSDLKEDHNKDVMIRCQN